MATQETRYRIPPPLPLDGSVLIEELDDSNFEYPDFFPPDLHVYDNRRVKDWLLGEGEWAGEKPGWTNYALDLETAAMKPGTWAWRNKRAMDVTLTLLGLPFVLPIMGLAALALFLTAGKDKEGKREPILFKQWRPGYLCKPFQILKFRTMRADGDSESPREDAQRLTRLGCFLRITSIDELPQLFNVLLGEMSLVGPRPQAMAYLPRFEKEGILRHAVHLGLVGENQIHARNNCTWESRIKDDLNYLNNRNIWRDLYLVVCGPIVALLGRGVQANGTVTMSEMS